MNLDNLFHLLKNHPGSPTIFNQYTADHGELDLPAGAQIRCHNLRCYLEAFAAARYALVGEAAGYAGCRFSGIPFTCEDQLLGTEPLPWTQGRDLARSSSTADSLWVERSARTVWAVLGQRADCVLWNAFPWHPFRPDEPLSNRAPGRALSQGFEVLGCFLHVCDGSLGTIELEPGPSTIIQPPADLISPGFPAATKLFSCFYINGK